MTTPDANADISPEVTLEEATHIAIAHHQAGRLAEAETIYRQILDADPDFPDALHLLGVIATQVGRTDAAIELIQKALVRITPGKPPEASYLSNLGEAFRRAGRLDEAAAAYEKALAQEPNLAAAHSNLGNVHKERRRLADAAACYRRALALDPTIADAHGNLGTILADQGLLLEALACYQQALALRPDYAEGWYNLGLAQRGLGHTDLAIDSFRKATNIRPTIYQAHRALGYSLRDKGRLDEALVSLNQSLNLKPDEADTYNDLANARRDQGRLDEAVACYRRAIGLKPDSAAYHSNLVYTLHFHSGFDGPAILHEHQYWNTKHAAMIQPLADPFSNSRDPNRRLRIGYVSADFREHCQAFFTTPLLSWHDHDQYEIFCYADIAAPDALTTRLRGYADVWRDIRPLTDDQAAALIREDRIDILVDLGMHMARSRLMIFARKPAPVQVSWLAYPGTTGLATMDFRLTDIHLDPLPNSDASAESSPRDAFYTERSIRLPETFWCYDPLTAEPLVNDLPARANGYITFGCLNNFCKINEAVLQLWARVMQETPGSRLILMSEEGSHRQAVLAVLQRGGVAPERVEFVQRRPRGQYLETYQRIDVGLDTFPYNGHTTSLDAFWMGVPVVTLIGKTAVGRAGLCQLENLGLPELAAEVPEKFVEIAAGLARDLPRLLELRAGLRARMERSPLMDAPRFARNMESAYRQMWQLWCAEKPEPVAS